MKPTFAASMATETFPLALSTRRGGRTRRSAADVDLDGRSLALVARPTNGSPGALFDP
jgi:hypothetical protein